VLNLPHTLPPNDNDGLQADVMRFLAIIAFCLIAVLALVRQTAAPEPPAATAQIRQVAAAEPAPPEPPKRESRPIPAAAAFPARRPPPAPRQAPVRELAPAPPPVPAPSAEKDAEPAAPAPGGDQGLTLRFASERDFLTLLRRGDIGIYAYQPGLVLGLSPEFRFEPVAGPGALYEMQRSTIPAAVTELLADSEYDADAGALTWGVRLPARIRRAIDSRLQQGLSGALLIDASGGVRHVAAG